MRRLLVGGIVMLAGLGLMVPALAAPPRPPPGPPSSRPQPPVTPPGPRWTTTTVAPTTTTLPPTTTTAAPTTTTTLAPTTTTLAQIVLEGTAPVTDQGLIIYGLDFVGLPIPGGQPDTVRACSAGTTLDFAASSFDLSPGLRVEYLAEYGTVIVLADLDVVGTVTYRLVCA